MSLVFSLVLYQWRACFALLILTLALGGCGSTFSHYGGVKKSFLAGNPDRAVQLIKGAKKNYGSRSRLLYLMDQGMVLHLAERFQESNAVLEEAHVLVEEQYTKRLRDKASALLLNESVTPYEGSPFEQVFINVIKALNYACMQNWTESLVEARRIDHRLNVLSDNTEDDDYHEDPFARYLTGLLYEVAGDLNNAYVAYRKAEVVYAEAVAWSKIALPDSLKADLIRVATALHLNQDVAQYRAKYPDMATGSTPLFDPDMAQVIVVSYQGRGPEKEDLFIDVPISLDALALIGFTKSRFRRSTRATRGGEALLYGIHGRIARVAVPRLISHRSKVAYSSVQLANAQTSVQSHSQRLYDLNAVAAKNFDDGYNQTVLQAVARTALKMAAAEGIGYGARAAAPKKTKDLVGPIIAILARIFALATEEADTRSWRTLPSDIQFARLSVPAGSYDLVVDAVGHQGSILGSPTTRQLELQKGEVQFVLQHHLE